VVGLALLVVLMIILKIYIGRLSRDEDDQIVLDDAFDHVKAEQAAIMAKVNKLEPARKATLWLVGLRRCSWLGTTLWTLSTSSSSSL